MPERENGSLQAVYTKSTPGVLLRGTVTFGTQSVQTAVHHDSVVRELSSTSPIDVAQLEST
jgi:hypothetical protein